MEFLIWRLKFEGNMRFFVIFRKLGGCLLFLIYFNKVFRVEVGGRGNGGFRIFVDWCISLKVVGRNRDS